MLKIRKLLSLSVLIGLPITTTCFFFTTSCAMFDYSDYTSEHAQFINERTFSIYADHGDEGVLGTAWIFQKSQDSDYTYYFATNVHVASAFAPNLGLIPMYLAYNPDYSRRISFDYRAYYKIPSYTLLGKDSKTRPTKDEWNQSSSEGYEWDVDFDVFKIDFGTTETQIENSDPFKTPFTKSPLLNRLNGLNAYAAEHENKIVEFASSDYSYESTNIPIHVGGFPYRPKGSSGSAKWTSYSITSSGFGFGYNTTNNKFFGVDDPEISFKDGIAINIVGKVIDYKRHSTPEFTGGSSGSMIVDDEDRVIAINFAGSSPSDDEYTSNQNYGLFLNTRNKYFGLEDFQYEVLTDWFSNLP